MTNCIIYWVIFVPSPSLLKISDSLLKNPIYYNILEFVPKSHVGSQFKCRLLTTNLDIKPFSSSSPFESVRDKRQAGVLEGGPSPSLLKASDSLLKNPTNYNILEFVPKNNAKTNLSAARSQRAVILNLPQAQVPLKASVTSGSQAVLEGAKRSTSKPSANASWI